MQDLMTRVQSAVQSSLTMVQNELDTMYERQQRYALSLLTYALRLAANMENATPQIENAADTALEYLEQLSVGGGWCLDCLRASYKCTEHAVSLTTN